MSLAVRAPGKAIVCGEYAVLEGAPAISIAIDRYVVAKLGDGPGSPFVSAALAHAARALGDASLATLRVTVDSKSLYEGDGKIGLGSSAAVTAAVVGLAFAQASASLEDRAHLFSIADAAHAEAQGVVGSGIDVATSIYGGAIRFQRTAGQAPQITPVAWPDALLVGFVFSGQSASTPDLVGRVRNLRDRDEPRYAACMGALAEVARAFSAAIDASDAASAVAAIARWQPALAQLGLAADAPIVTPFFEFVAATAARHGAAAKPSGAGGGDLGIILSVRSPVSTLARTLAHEGIAPLRLAGPAVGLSLEITQ